METTRVGYIGIIGNLAFFGDNGKENGNDCNGLYKCRV